MKYGVFGDIALIRLFLLKESISKEDLIGKLEDYKAKVSTLFIHVFTWTFEKIRLQISDSVISFVFLSFTTPYLLCIIPGTGKTEKVRVRACRIKKQGTTFVMIFFICSFRLVGHQ